MEKKLLLSMAALSALGFINTADAARASGDACGPTAPANCYPADECCSTYCVGPDNYGVNAPVRPFTCNGDFVVEIAGFYWNAHQGGLKYAVESGVQIEQTSVTSVLLPSLVNAEYKNPNFNWDFGFKAGIGYNSACDGWDLGINWTWYQGRATSHDEAEEDDNRALFPLWFAFPSTQTEIISGQIPALLFVRDIESHWKLKMNLIDLSLGREFWVSPKVTVRPHFGLRIAYLEQSFELEHKGGSLSDAGDVDIPAGSLIDFVEIDNDFKGAGIRAGLDSIWNLGCGFGIYGNMAFAAIYGKFSVDHDEYVRQTSSPFSKFQVIQTDESLRQTTFSADLGLGLEWSKLICNCQYGFTASLGWEHHIFFDQNQMTRVARAPLDTVYGNTAINGINSYEDRNGNLDTQGWTLKFVFDF